MKKVIGYPAVLAGYVLAWVIPAETFAHTGWLQWPGLLVGGLGLSYLVVRWSDYWWKKGWL